ncbi:MBL fold metallo-hydrolase [Kordiimonas sp. SCSIO 12603]|uniref:MBL fold metallo-hydrolase n=1 Tax=Kordiimonas sp. SCSIO 12603 TaxID=2829596 RepID=UPI002102F2DE|nr:MBL fold metallo-hydrolase [Kordiimonas sp. SCSIO 12603]UTW57888.1 MBL fold metallo-hydrolase [Kordiimonas sp. SCSIO 12603]
MDKLSSFLLFCAGIFSAVPSVAVGEKEDIIADKALQAYGGDQLLKLQSVKLRTKYKRLSNDQGYIAGEFDIIHYDNSVIIDFENKRKEFRVRNGLLNDPSMQHHIFDGEQAYRIYEATKQLQRNSGRTFTSIDWRMPERFDPLLAKLLYENKETASYKGVGVIEGKPVEKISFKAHGYPEYTLYVDASSGLIHRMTRSHWQPGVDFAYNFIDHSNSSRIPFAKQLYVTKGGMPENISVKRAADFDYDLKGAFQIPDNYEDMSAGIDTSDMAVEKLATGFYHVGQGWSYTLFIDAGDHYIGLGGYDGLKDRFEALQKETGDKKPLKLVAVSHHHSDHIGGTGDAFDLGATIVTTPDSHAAIRRVSGKDIPDERFITAEARGEIADGLVKYFDLPNDHAEHHLMFYVPSLKMMLTGDFFFSRQVAGAPKGHETLRDFKAAIEKAGFDVKYLAAEHSSRVLTLADLDAAIADMAPKQVCPASWEICQD